jgi:hypothetical protein
MSFGIRKLTFSPSQPYRYEIMGELGELIFTAERDSPWLPNPTRRVTFRNPAGDLVATVEPPELLAPWREQVIYGLRFPGDEQPRYSIEESFPTVDRVLLRVPNYHMAWGNSAYVVRGSRYGLHFYELFDENDDLIGEITRPLSGPSYNVESQSPALSQSPLILATLAIIIDMVMADDEVEGRRDMSRSRE